MHESKADAIRYNTIGGVRIKHLQEISIFASRSGNISEPSLRWDTELRSYDTGAIRSQLATSVDNNKDRAILELDIRKLKQNQQDWSKSWAPNRNLSFSGGNLSMKVVRHEKRLLIFTRWILPSPLVSKHHQQPQLREWLDRLRR